MANPKIEVEIGAKTDQLAKGFTQSESIIKSLQQRLSNLKNNLENATDIKSIAQYNIRIKTTESELKRLSSVGLQTGNALNNIPNSLLRTSSGVNQLRNATSSYNGVGIEFSRIIQDAPFGILGVGNNITRLAETFTQARNSGQSFTQILGGVLKGGNALVLGISLLTTAFTILSQQGFFKSKESAEDAEEALTKYREALDDIRKSALQGEITAQKEIQNFELLRKQAENANIPLGKRIEAVKELQKSFPDYLTNLTQEQILTGNVGTAYDNLTKSLLETAKARAASNIIIKNTEEVLTLQQQQLDNEQAIIDARDKVARLEASAANSAVNALKINGQITAQNTDLVDAKNKLNKLLEPQIERGNRINELTTTNLNLNNEINTSLEKGASFTKTTLGSTEKIVKESIQFNDTLTETIRLQNLIASISKEIADKPEKNSVSGIFELGNLAGDKPPIVEEVDVFEAQKNRLLEFANEISGAFGGVGSAISQAFGKSPAFGQFLGQFLAFASKLVAANFKIALSTSIAGATKTALATGPGAAIALPALIAGAVGLVGSAFAAFGGGKGGGGGGGSIGGGVGAQSYNGAALETSQNFEFVPLKIQGADIYYSLEQQAKKRNQG